MQKFSGYQLFRYEYGQSNIYESTLNKINNLIQRLKEALRTDKQEKIQKIIESLESQIPTLRGLLFRNLSEDDFTSEPELSAQAKLQKELFFIANEITNSLMPSIPSAPSTLSFESYLIKIKPVLISLETIAALGNANIAFNLSCLYSSRTRPTPSFIFPFKEKFSYEGFNIEAHASVSLIHTQRYSELLKFFTSSSEKNFFASKSAVWAEHAFKLCASPIYALQACIALHKFYSLYEGNLPSEEFLQRIKPYLEHFLLANIDAEKRIEPGMKAVILGIISKILNTQASEKIKRAYIVEPISQNTFKIFKKMLIQFKEQFPSEKHNQAVDNFLTHIEKLINLNEVSNEEPGVPLKLF